MCGAEFQVFSFRELLLHRLVYRMTLIGGSPTFRAKYCDHGLTLDTYLGNGGIVLGDAGT